MMKDGLGNLIPCSWEDALVSVAQKMSSLKGEEMAAVVGGMVDAEALVALKDLFNKCNSEGLYTEEGFPSVGSRWVLRASYSDHNCIFH
jgi:NADH dehydrogenase (ubiquinone) Fe-S protein 1